MSKTIVLVAALDTKAQEASIVRDFIRSRGHTVLVADCGVLGQPGMHAGIERSEVARAGRSTIDELVRRNDRGYAISVMTDGMAALASLLHREGRLDGIIGIGGSAGTSVGTTAMRALPIGVPKLMVSTVASGDTRPYVGMKDVTMMYSVVDIAGINRLSRRILTNAAGAICGMVDASDAGASATEKPMVGATMFGVTTPCVTHAREILEQAGYEVLVFHATGTGGQVLEGLVADGYMSGVLDVTTTEWADELVGGVLSAGPHRLEAAARTGVPQVVSVGALDMVNFGPHDSVPARFHGRRMYQHNPFITLMRTTVAENRQLGRILAEKLNASTGPAVIFLPLRGVSLIDVEGGPFDDPDARGALFSAIRENLDRDRVGLVEMDHAINDPAFSAAMANTLLKLMATTVHT